MSKEINIFESFEYLGEFWFAKRSQYKFPGNFKYSPEGGIKIEFISTLKNLSIERLIKEDFVLFGCVKELGNITIFPRDLVNLSITWGNKGKDTYITERGTICSELAIIGHHFKNKKETVFSSCSFTFNHLDSFCSPNPMLEKHEKDNTLLASNLEKFNLNLKQTITYSPSLRQVSDLIFLQNDKIRNEIDSAVSKILKKHKISGLDQKERVCYYFTIKSKRNRLASTKEYFDILFKAKNLFSHLLWRPLFPTNISFCKNKKSYSAILSLHLSKAQFQSVKSEADFHFLPTNIHNIKKNFNQILQYWIKYSDWEFNTPYETITDHILDIYDPVSHYLLFIISIERWQIEQQKPHNSCYDDFINTYASDESKDLLLSLLPVDINRNEIGQALGKIRDIILHPKKIKEDKFKKYKSYLKPANIGNLTEKIFVLFIVALYKEFNLEDSLINKIQKDFFSKGMRDWS